MHDGSQDVDELFQRAVDGSQQALGELLDRYRERLGRMVRFRLHRRVRTRVDPSDVIQEAFIDAARRLSAYASNPSVTFYVWLRYLTNQRLQMIHRHHLGIQSRDARREVSLGGSEPAATSAVLAAGFLKGLTSPSTAAARKETKQQLLAALDAMDPMDREVLALRHFEQLSNTEVAQTLGISSTAANNRYVRALERFRPVVSAIPGIFVESKAGFQVADQWATPISRWIRLASSRRTLLSDSAAANIPRSLTIVKSTSSWRRASGNCSLGCC
jgi:RNA polymerase sigma-70 factor (ECF subfamily)